ncbi:hypothetical protein TNCV_2304881 [Trichonephila clavipes]|nr:hypothetical protein TNCV_2304881 [Trichonephila clavipes]
MILVFEHLLRFELTARRQRDLDRNNQSTAIHDYFEYVTLERCGNLERDASSGSLLDRGSKERDSSSTALA